MFHYNNIDYYRKNKRSRAYYISSTTVRLLLMIILAASVLSGCGSQDSVQDNYVEASESASDDGLGRNISGRQVFAPVELTYTVNNPLALTYEEITEGTNEEENIIVNHQICTVAGLKDKDAEQKINERIREVYEELITSDLPPYRGIKKKIPENALRTEDYIYISEEANFNNILSLIIQRNTIYAIPNKNGSYLKVPEGYYKNTESVIDNRTLNFDLNTGEEFGLVDVFTENSDYMALLNDAVEEELKSTDAQEEEYFIRWGGLKLTESFKGLSEDQKFCVTPYSVRLIFDYDTPQFYFDGFWAHSIEVNFGYLNGELAVTERFYDEDTESIFISDEPSGKSLIYLGSNSELGNGEYYKDGSVQVYNMYRYPSVFPEELKYEVEMFSKPDQSIINQLNDMVKASQPQPGEEVYAYYEHNVYGNKTGNYYTIQAHAFAGFQNFSVIKQEMHTYDADSIRELAITDIFKSGFDYKPVLTEALKKGISDMGGLYKDGMRLTEDELSAETARLAENLKGFCLDANYIGFITEEAEFSDSRIMPVYFNIAYDDIGYDNITIFE